MPVFTSGPGVACCCHRKGMTNRQRLSTEPNHLTLSPSLPRYWRSMSLLVKSLLDSMSAIVSLLVLLILFISIFAMLGTQLFGGRFQPPSSRSRFESFIGSFLTVFQVDITQSHCHTVTLSHCHTVTLSHCHTVTLSHCIPGRQNTVFQI